MLQELKGADSLAIDCEGVNLGPQGQLCLMQLAARQGSHATASSSAASRAPSMQAAAATTPAAGPSSPPASPAPAAGPLKRPAGSGGGGKSPPLSIFIVDVHQLQWRAFHYRADPADPTSINLKALLENPAITKLIYDVRSDSSNLMRQFDVRLKGAYDLQVG
jgi:hypothetical protein